MNEGNEHRWLQWIAAGAVVAPAMFLLWLTKWPFTRPHPRLPVRPSLAQLILSDRITLGFVRYAVVVTAVFVIASVPALIIAGRWLRAFSSHLPVDERQRVQANREVGLVYGVGLTQLEELLKKEANKGSKTSGSDSS